MIVDFVLLLYTHDGHDRLSIRAIDGQSVKLKIKGKLFQQQQTRA